MEASELEFRAIAIKITGLSGRERQAREVFATEAVGTGLAYHQDPNEHDDPEDTGGFVVTHIRSGKCLGRRRVDTPRQARKWIELLVELADWNKSGAELIRRYQRLEVLARQVEQARTRAIEKSIFVKTSF